MSVTEIMPWSNRGHVFVYAHGRFLTVAHSRASRDIVFTRVMDVDVAHSLLLNAHTTVTDDRVLSSIFCHEVLCFCCHTVC